MAATRMDYKCTLCEKSVKKARKELNEDPKERLGAVETLRDWTEREPWMNAPRDTKFFLSFLRWSKFSQLKARERLTNYMQLSHDPRFDYFLGNDPGDDCNLEIYRQGLFVMLPGKCKQGRHVILSRFEPEIMKHYSSSDAVRAVEPIVSAMTFFLEEVQVNGITFIADCGGLSMKMLMWWGADKLKQLAELITTATPLRLKELHYINAGPAVESGMAVFSPFVSSKHMKRIKTHKTLVPIYDAVDMSILPEEYLPDDYDGQTAGSIRDIAEWNIKEFFLHPQRREILKDYYSGKYYADKNRGPKDIETMASFRKLSVA